MSLFGMQDNIPCCCIGGCCEDTVLPECITLELTASCCGATVTVELCQNTGPPVQGVDGAPKYTGALTTNWCYSEPTENIYVLNSTVAVWCQTNEITGEKEWYIFINDTNAQHSWHPPSAEFVAMAYRLTLVSCNPLLLTFGGDAGCTGDNCAYTWEAACFIHGTLIATPRGFVPIEALQVGEEVYDADHSVVEVQAIHHSTAEVILFLADEDGVQTGVTPEHPFLSRDGNTFVLAGHLKTGDRLRHGKTIGHVKALVEATSVVNLTVSGSKTFIANGFAVHNKGE